MKLAITLFALLFSSTVYSQTVTHVEGVVFANKKQPVKKGAKLEWGSSIYSDDAKSFVRIKMDKGQILLKSKFKLNLKKPSAEISSFDLVYGKVRALVNSKKNSKQRFEINTPTAVAGVRGTDFYLSYLPLLGESEIICFKGRVGFGAKKNKPVEIKSGQWGGHGGRFGNKVGKVLDLPKSVLKHFQSDMPL